METRLLACEHVTSVIEIASWANALLGKEVPGDSDHLVVSVQHFQLVNGSSGYDAMLLVEVTERQNDTQIALSAADVEVIQELTSSIDEPL